MAITEVFIPSNESSRLQNWVIRKRLQALCRLNASVDRTGRILLVRVLYIVVASALFALTMRLSELGTDGLSIGIINLSPHALLVGMYAACIACILSPVLSLVKLLVSYTFYDAVVQTAIDYKVIYRISTR